MSLEPTRFAGRGVTINALAPTVIRAPLVAAMAAFILSPEASFTTGFTFDLSGGRAVY